VLADWEYLFTRKLLKNAGFFWHGLPPYRPLAYHDFPMSGLVAMSAMPQVLAETSPQWIDDVLDYIDALAKLSNVRLSLPANPAQHIAEWVQPKPGEQVPDRMFNTILTLPVPNPENPNSYSEWETLPESIRRYGNPNILDWERSDLLRTLIPFLHPTLRSLVKKVMYGRQEAITLNLPVLTPEGIKGLSVAEEPPLVYSFVRPGFPGIMAHELGHAAIPQFVVEEQATHVDPVRLHDELTNIGALHRALPVLVERLRKRLGESPFSANTVGRLLNTLIGLHKIYLNNLTNWRGRSWLRPERPTDAHINLVLDSLSRLDNLRNDPWGRAVLTYAGLHLTGQNWEDFQTDWARGNLHNDLAYLVATINAYLAGRPLGNLHFHNFLNELDVIHRRRGTTSKQSPLTQLFDIAITGPKSPDELASALEIAKKEIPEVKELYPYQRIKSLLAEAVKSPEKYESLFRYPKITQIPNLTESRIRYRPMLDG